MLYSNTQAIFICTFYDNLLCLYHKRDLEHCIFTARCYAERGIYCDGKVVCLPVRP